MHCSQSDLSDKCDEVTQEEMVNEESDFDQIPDPYDDEQLIMLEEKGAPAVRGFSVLYMTKHVQC